MLNKIIEITLDLETLFIFTAPSDKVCFQERQSVKTTCFSVYFFTHCPPPPPTFIIFVTLTLNVNLYMFSIWSEMDTYLPDIRPTKSSFLPICHLEEGGV